VDSRYLAQYSNQISPEQKPALYIACRNSDIVKPTKHVVYQFCMFQFLRAQVKAEDRLTLV
jgi:hypothetical protein